MTENESGKYKFYLATLKEGLKFCTPDKLFDGTFCIVTAQCIFFYTSE